MSVTFDNGFKIFEGDTLIIESGKIRDCMEFFLNNAYLEKIWISRYHGYLAANISFLQEYNFIKKIIINGPFDISGLYHLKNLEYLSYENYIKDFLLDLSAFENIRTCYLDLKSKVENINSLKKVFDLRLFHYSIKEKNLSGLSNLTLLESLYISTSNAESLVGIELLQKLKKIEFHQFRNLEKIGSIVNLSDSLIELLLGNAKRITDYEQVSFLKNLKILGFLNCASIKSITFINDMPNLVDLRVIGTDILDGDMTPCMRLEYAAFTNKRHFSHTMEQIKLIHGNLSKPPL